MEIGVPTWNSSTMGYSFQILQSDSVLEDLVYYEAQELNLPATDSISKAFVEEFLEKTKKYFTNPLIPEKVLRHLRHIQKASTLPTVAGWYSFQWKPSSFIVKSGDFQLVWQVVSFKEATPVIPAEFTASTTPRAQTPQVPEQASEQVRSIQIHDSLIPVGDLPLSDLPPLSFTTEEVDMDRESTKRRIREARLKVALAKLKAQRLEHKYFERYGQAAEDSEESSSLSTESEEEEGSFEPHLRR